jgi:P-type E1-E2 ATPase
VPGDVVIVEAGDRVPADLRLLEARGPSVQEAALMGEVVAVDRGLRGRARRPKGDRASMVFSGTLATGRAPEIGGITELRTPLVAQIDRFSRVLTVVILIACAAMFVCAVALRGMAVAAIPEGLPAVLSITLALGMQRMARRRASRAACRRSKRRARSR